jgi:ankyrin repeat protein
MNKRNILRGLMACAAAIVVFIVAVALHGAWVLRGTPLLGAVGDGDVEKVKFILQHGADINERSKNLIGWTPLTAAVQANRTNVVHFLIEAGADVNLPEGDGKTPLICAAQWGDEGVPIVKDLIAHGAKLNAKDKQGNTVLDLARSAPPKPELLATLEAAKTSTNDAH